MPTGTGEVVDRRTDLELRELKSSAKDLERQHGRGRRMTDFLRAAEDGEMTQEQFVFLVAIDAFKETKRKNISYMDRCVGGCSEAWIQKDAAK